MQVQLNFSVPLMLGILHSVFALRYVKGLLLACRYEKNVWWNRRGGNYNATKGEELEYFLETNGYEVRYFGVDEYVGKPESNLVKHYFGKCYG